MEEIDRSNIIQNYIQGLRHSKTTCVDCNRVFYEGIQNRWSKPKPEGTKICNPCWNKSQQVLTDEIWKKIYEYKPHKCEICLTQKNKCCYSNENVFNPLRLRITDLVDKQADWNIIQKYLDECHVFCLECDLIVNRLLTTELKYGWINYKIDKQFVEDKIDSDTYDEKMEFYKSDYEIKKKEIIDGLSQLFVE